MIERMESAMKTSDWALIQTLYECRNITRAAAQLYISQPTLTKRLRAIEEDLGVVIALRGKRGVTFTPEGEYLAVKATQFLSLMDEVNRHLTELKEEPSGTLCIGASNSMARFSLPGLLQYYQESHPGISFEITTSLSSQLCKRVERRELDLAFAFGDIPFKGVKYRFASEQAYLASVKPLDMSRLSSYPYITYFKDKYTQQLIENWWAEYYLTPFPRGLVVQHGDICREMILKGLGYSFFFVRGYMADHPQYVYPLHYKDGTPLLRNTWLLCPDQPENLRPEVQSFIREALDYSRSQPSHA